MDADTLCILLNASQLLRRRHVPIMLAFAGTPRLTLTLSAAGASFYDKAEIIHVGLLSALDVRRAFDGTMAVTGKSFEQGALDEAVRLVHGYPYFIQLLGEHLHDQCEREETDRVTSGVLERTLQDFELRRNGFYGLRLRELRRENLIEPAVSLAADVSSGATFTAEELNRRLQTGMGVDRQEADRELDRLHDAGFVWPHDGDNYSAGIPSLATYILERSGDVAREIAARRNNPSPDR